MNLSDHRFARVLSDARLEQAKAIRQKQIHNKRQSARHRLGLLLIAQGEKLAKGQAKVA